MTDTIDELVLIELRRIIFATQLNARALAQRSGKIPSQHVVMQLLQTRREWTAREIFSSHAPHAGHGDHLARVAPVLDVGRVDRSADRED